MRLFHALFPAPIPALFWSLALFAGFSNASHALDMTEATNQVKALPCKDDQTIEQTLDSSVRRGSQRDLGWRTFQEADYYDIERAVLINKGMELRYRWRVSATGGIAPQSDRAEKLCRANTD